MRRRPSGITLTGVARSIAAIESYRAGLELLDESLKSADNLNPQVGTSPLSPPHYLPSHPARARNSPARRRR